MKHKTSHYGESLHGQPVQYHKTKHKQGATFTCAKAKRMQQKQVRRLGAHQTPLKSQKNEYKRRFGGGTTWSSSCSEWCGSSASICSPFPRLSLQAAPYLELPFPHARICLLLQLCLWLWFQTWHMSMPLSTLPPCMRGPIHRPKPRAGLLP